MALSAEQLKSELVNAVVGRVQERLEDARSVTAADFVRHYFANVPSDDILGESADNLYGSALSLLGLAKQRAAGEARIRVYNPRLEEQGWKSSHTIVEIINDDMPFLVDSVTAELNRLDVEVHLVIHPVLGVERDAKGKLSAVHESGAGPNLSLIHI